MKHFIQKRPFIKIFSGTLFLIIFVLTSSCDILPAAPTLTQTATITQTGIPTPTIDWFPATPTPTLQAITSPTPQPTRGGLREGIVALIVDDDFTDQSLWETYQSSFGNAAFGAQNLTLAVSQENASLTSLSQHSLPSNFYLEVSIQTSLCQPSDQIGIIFWRQSQGEYYRLLVDNSGRYRLEVAQGGQNVVVHDWETANQMELATQATNRLGLYVNEGQFQLFINDAFQFSESIARDRDGGLEFFARTINGNAMTVRFSDLQIYQVEAD